MPRMLQDIRLEGADRQVVVLSETPLEEGVTQESVACERMHDHAADKTSRVWAVRVIDDEGSELFRYSLDDITQEKLEKLRRTAARVLKERTGDA